MERPSEEFRISTPLSIGIAIVLCAVAALIWSSLGKSEGYMFLGSLLLSLGCLLLAGISLWFAESRLVYWVGIVVIIGLASWKA